MSKLHEKALDSIFGDMDDFESKKMFGGGEAEGKDKGFSIVITMNPNESHEEQEKEEGVEGGMDDLPADHDIELCKGGCAYHKGGAVGMAKGGVVEPESDTSDLSLPPFLRKKKKLPSNG